VAVLVVTPKGDCKGSADRSHSYLDIPLPDGVEEDEVDVFSCFLDAGQNVPHGVGPVLLQAARRKPVLESAVASVETVAQKVVSAAEAAVAAVESVVKLAPAIEAPVAEPAPATEPASAADAPAADAPVADAPAKSPADCEQEAADQYGAAKTQPNICVD
jgi:hypothetical protein